MPMPSRSVLFLMHFDLIVPFVSTVLYHMPARQDAAAAKDLARREEELASLKAKHNIPDE